MKRINFLALLLLSLFSANMFAQVQERRWLSDMPDSMRIAQLSIPKAHDAATYGIDDAWYKCQTYNESTLFNWGVRSFDLRLGAKFKRTGDKQYEITQKAFYHSDEQVNNYEDEVSRWPTKDQLDGTTGSIKDSEFLIFNIKLEYYDCDKKNKKEDYGGYDYETYLRRMAYDSILGSIKARYGDKDLAGNPRFVPFRDDLTVDQMRGKIFIFLSSQSAGPKSLANYTYSNYVPVNLGEDGEKYGVSSYACPSEIKDKYDIDEGKITQSFTRTYFDNSTSERQTGATETGVKVQLSQEYYQGNRTREAMGSYFRWAEEFFHSRIDMLNTQNIMFDGHLNGWKTWEWGHWGPFKTATDDGDDFGANHRAYNYIKTTKKPLGIVGFDFCGVGKETYGDKLLEEIVNHNYYQKELMKQEKKYIADVMLVRVDKTNNEKGDEKHAQELMKNNGGYEMVGNSGDADLIKNNGLTGDRLSRIFMGVKYTDNPDSALTNLILVVHGNELIDEYNSFYKKRYNNNFKPDDKIEFWGSPYYQPVKVYDDYSYWKGWGGTFTVHMNGDWQWLYLWQERHPRYNKNDNCGALTDIKILRGGDIPDYTSNLVPYMRMNGTNDWPHGANSTEVGNSNITITIPRGTYLQFEKHLHNHDGSGVDDKGNYNCCTFCGYKFYDEQVHKATLNSNSEYEIANAEQFFWFARLVANDEPKANAILTSDIVIPDGKMWTPIGTEKKPFQGTFDGQGHTISGIKTGGADYQGLFGYTLNATVKNLGMKDSYIKGRHNKRLVMNGLHLVFVEDSVKKEDTYVGSIVGYAKSTTIENVFSTAVIDNSYKTSYAGGLVGKLDRSKICNSFFDGTYSSDGGASCSKYIGVVGDGSELKNACAVKDKNCCTADTSSVTYVTREDFESGKLCLLLNDGKYGKDAMWRQNVDASIPNIDGYEVDATPVLNQNHDMVVPAKYNGKDFINLHTYYDGEDLKYHREFFDVSDNDDFSCPVEFDVMYAQQTRDMKGYTKGTVCLPFDIDDTTNGNIKLYKITAIDESNGKEAVLTLEEIDRLPAGTPAVFEKLDETIDTISFICNGGCTIYPAKEKEKFTSAPKYNTKSLGMMYGTYTRDSIAYNTATNIYAFRTSTNKFTRLQTGDTLLSKPFRGWIETLSDRTLQRYGIGTQNNGNDTSKRMKVTEDADSQLPMYDLSGRQVTNPVNGQVVIRDGKKIVYNNK